MQFFAMLLLSPTARKAREPTIILGYSIERVSVAWEKELDVTNVLIA
jgi:hypothetical protein